MKEKLQQIKFFFIDSWGFVRSLFIYLFRSIKRPGIFYGYNSWYWSNKYADKRATKWHYDWDQNGRQQGVFPVAEIKLLVCSKLELEFFRKKGILNKTIKPRKAIKKSYYTTAL